jgi:hypothetical protein
MRRHTSSSSKLRRNNRSSRPPSCHRSADLIDEIKRLADLKDQGILSDAEFSAANAKLLGT